MQHHTAGESDSHFVFVQIKFGIVDIQEDRNTGTIGRRFHIFLHLRFETDSLIVVKLHIDLIRSGEIGNVRLRHRVLNLQLVRVDQANDPLPGLYLLIVLYILLLDKSIERSTQFRLFQLVLCIFECSLCVGIRGFGRLILLLRDSLFG